jgi:hypothetical protein
MRAQPRAWRGFTERPRPARVVFCAKTLRGEIFFNSGRLQAGTSGRRSRWPGGAAGLLGNSEPNVAGSWDLPQAQTQHGVVEASVDAVEDGAGEPPGLIGGGAPGVLCMRRTRRSRAASCSMWLPAPELVPVVVAGRAHSALKPTPRHEPCRRTPTRSHSRGPEAGARQAVLQCRAQAGSGGARVRP